MAVNRPGFLAARLPANASASRTRTSRIFTFLIPSNTQTLHARIVICRKREGASKISDHHVRSPLLNINRACQTCHKWSEDELKARVETIQSRTHNLRNLAMDALVELINDIKAARDAGRTDAGVNAAQDFQRRAQFYVDFIESENSNGFHASQEAARILGESINFSRKGHVALRSGVPSSSVQDK